jgi:CYTH domain-containing protein
VAEEIERKFLLTAVPGAEVLGPGRRLRQGYVAVDGAVEVRVRIDDGGAVLTVKAGSGLARTEVELPLDGADADALWAHTAGRRIEKRRHRCALGDDGPVAEVDLFDGDLDGLAVVEVEFPDAGAAAAFEPPPWFGRELTGEGGWSNADLARFGRPPG